MTTRIKNILAHRLFNKNYTSCNELETSEISHNLNERVLYKNNRSYIDY